MGDLGGFGQMKLAAPLLGNSDSGSDRANSNSPQSPLPPSASKSGLDAISGSSGGFSPALRLDVTPGQLRSSPQDKATPATPAREGSWTAVSHALPIALMNIAQALAHAQLVCNGTNLDAALVAGMHLLGLVVVQGGLAGFSRIGRYAIATPDVTFAMLMAGAASAVYETSGLESAEARAATALTALGVCTLLQGLCYYALGRLKGSALVQFLPYPVVCGLLGVTGLGICQAAVGVSGLDETSVLGFVASARARPAQAIAALALAGSSMGITALSNSGTAFLLCVPCALLLFYGGSGFNGASYEELVANGWLFERAPERYALADLWLVRRLPFVLWREALPDTIPAFSRCLVSLTALVLKVLTLEATAGVPVDVDLELRVAGLANLACSLLGGSLANHSAQYVGPLRRAGVASRGVALTSMAITAAVLASGMPLMEVVPRFLLGGLLLATGAQMVIDWAWSSRLRMDAMGYGVLCAMMLMAMIAGPTPALYLGLLSAVASSHLRTSRLNALKYQLSGESVHAPVSRPAHHQVFLERHGRAIHLIGLEGYLFEGTTARLLRYVLALIRRSPGAMHFLVLDMNMCQGVDPSACALLGRAARTLSDRAVQLVLASPQPAILPMLVAHSVLSAEATEPAGMGAGLGGVGGGGGGVDGAAVFRGRAVHMASLDHALEWCEDQLIVHSSPPSIDTAGGGGGGGSGGAQVAVHVGGAAARRRPHAQPTPSPDGAPFAPSSLPSTLSFEALLAYGALQPASVGDVLTSSGAAAREVFVAPPQGVAIEVSVQVGGTATTFTDDASLATLRHGGLFGVGGALLGVPATFTARVVACERGASLLVIGGIGLSKVRSSQPSLLQRLLSAHLQQQHDLTNLLARRALLWRGGGWRGPATGIEHGDSSRPVGVRRRDSTGFPHDE